MSPNVSGRVDVTPYMLNFPVTSNLATFGKRLAKKTLNVVKVPDSTHGVTIGPVLATPLRSD